jgi:hypothetical protein
MSEVAAIAALAMKACVDVAGSDRGRKYANALATQAKTFRSIADKLDEECIKTLLIEADGAGPRT